MDQWTQTQIDAQTEAPETYTLERENAPDVRFEGWEVARADSRRLGENPPRWTSLWLYVSKGGKILAHKVGHTRLEGEVNLYTLHICDTPAELREVLGHGWLAKSLYDEAGIDYVEEVE
ncbi:hypothetical protein [Oceanidesulfovibrio marinus]|nr:hypothetical protein [Oceanidesulfovibrio marinus]